jgi:hypothetical protein
MKKTFVTLVFAAALAAPVGWASVASAKPGPDPDANGDVHSNCHTGSKGRGAGGEDNGPGRPKDNSDVCAAAPVTPPGQPSAPGATAAGAAAAPASAGAGAAAVRAPAVTSTAAAAAPVVAAPRTTG